MKKIYKLAAGAMLALSLMTQCGVSTPESALQKALNAEDYAKIEVLVEKDWAQRSTLNCEAVVTDVAAYIMLIQKDMDNQNLDDCFLKEERAKELMSLIPDSDGFQDFKKDFKKEAGIELEDFLKQMEQIFSVVDMMKAFKDGAESSLDSLNSTIPDGLLY
ncbi:MAG: hypothetical protein MJZ61_08850 [Bacteroidales bacterium]|nr:hypothetical protein [Bacteroidales bacterium]